MHRHVFGPRDAYAMFGRKRTFELAHDGGNLVTNLAKFFQVLSAVEVEDGTDMEQSGRSMAVKAGHDAMRLQNRLQRRYIIRKAFGSNSGVLDASDRLGSSFAAGEQC